MSYLAIARGVAALPNGQRNPKDYPYWDQLIALLTNAGYEVKPVKELPFSELEVFLKSSLTVIAADSFVQHFCWSIGKQAIVLWGSGDPLIFGHPENINLLKSREYLRPGQFDMWMGVPYREDIFVDAEEVFKQVQQYFPLQRV